MTPALARSPRPFCPYCDMGLREMCPTRRAIDAGLPGLVLGAREGSQEAIVKRFTALAEKAKPRKIDRATLFRLFRENGCSLRRTARALDMNASALGASIDKETRLALGEGLRGGVQGSASSRSTSPRWRRAGSVDRRDPSRLRRAVLRRAVLRRAVARRRAATRAPSRSASRRLTLKSSTTPRTPHTRTTPTTCRCSAGSTRSTCPRASDAGIGRR